jgi:hypothetical protein
LYQTQHAYDQAEEALFTISEEDSGEDILSKLAYALALEEALEKEHQEQELEQEVDWLQSRRPALREKNGDEDESSSSLEILPHLVDLQRIGNLFFKVCGVSMSCYC